MIARKTATASSDRSKRKTAKQRSFGGTFRTAPRGAAPELARVRGRRREPPGRRCRADGTSSWATNHRNGTSTMLARSRWSETPMQNRQRVKMDRQPPTFLIGAARSGTSLLYKGLCLHPDAAYFNNYLRRLPRILRSGLPITYPRHDARASTPGLVLRRIECIRLSGARRLRDRLYPMPVGASRCTPHVAFPTAVSSDTVSMNAAREFAVRYRAPCAGAAARTSSTSALPTSSHPTASRPRFPMRASSTSLVTAAPLRSRCPASTGGRTASSGGTVGRQSVA